MARVVHICPRFAPARGGVESFFRRLSEHLASHGDNVEVWTTDASTVRAFTAAGDARLPAGLEPINGVQVRRFPIRYVPLQKYTRTAAHLLPLGEAWKCNTLRWTPWVPSLTQAARAYDQPIDIVHAAPLPYSSILHAAGVLAHRTGAKLVVSPFTSPSMANTSSPVRPSDTALSPALNWSGTTPMPTKLLRWIRS